MFRLWRTGEQGIDIVDKQERRVGSETFVVESELVEGQVGKFGGKQGLEKRPAVRSDIKKVKFHSSKAMIKIVRRKESINVIFVMSLCFFYFLFFNI
jgi:hypothetical protein